MGLFLFLFFLPNSFFLIQQGKLENCPKKSVRWAVETWKVVFDLGDEGEKMKEILRCMTTGINKIIYQY